MSMTTVIGKYEIARPKRLGHRDAGKLLADAGVNGAEQLSLGKERKKPLLDLADENRLAIELGGDAVIQTAGASSRISVAKAALP